MVEGEPGIGKTWLLSELRRRAEERGHLVLAGSAAESSATSVRRLGRRTRCLRRLSRARRGKDLDGESGDLCGVLPSLKRNGTRAPGLVESVTGLIARSALCWRDRGGRRRSRRARRPGLERRRGRSRYWPRSCAAGTESAGPAGLGYRSGRRPRSSARRSRHPVKDHRARAAEQTECSTLAGEHLDAAQRAAIYAQSGGNPFYTLQLAHASALPSRSSTGDRLALDAGVPRTVAAALVEELETLTADARLLLTSASIAGDPFEPELAYAIAELSPQAGVAALDELLDARLLHATDVPRRFAFRHPLVRRAVLRDQQGRLAAGRHARAAQALAAQGASAAARAHHVEQSGVRGERAAIELLLEAGDANAPRAPAGAARWYAAALRLMPEEAVRHACAR